MGSDRQADAPPVADCAQAGSGASDGIFKTENGVQVSANGGRTNQNNIQIDGVGVTSVSWGGASVITPNEDSVKDVPTLAFSKKALIFGGQFFRSSW